jgi:hypothetical protein
VAPAAILGTTLTGLGGLLGGTGACLVVLGVLVDPGEVWGGRSTLPAGRLSQGAELIGSVLLAAGAVILLVASSLSASIIVVVLGGAAALTYGATSFRLHQYMPPGERRSWWWCLSHPRWRGSGR